MNLDKMKTLIYILLILAFTSCASAQKINIPDYSLQENLPAWFMFSWNKVKTETEVEVVNNINPYYLEADFNGDDKLDIALIVESIPDRKRGILLVHGHSFKSKVIGAGSKFGNGGDDFKWMDTWKVYREPTAMETTFTQNFDIAGQRSIELKNIAISVASSEGASNLIVFDGENYVWVHTGS